MTCKSGVKPSMDLAKLIAPRPALGGHEVIESVAVSSAAVEVLMQYSLGCASEHTPVSSQDSAFRRRKLPFDALVFQFIQEPTPCIRIEKSRS